MLTIAALGSGQARYYLSLTASSYYTEAPEPEGRWYGLGAQEFGLEGAVKAEDLIKLCEGYHPHDPSKHVRNAGVTEGDRARKHGDDLCFSAPKSVSVAWALGSPELRSDIEKAMQRAVKEALDYIQAECGWSRVGAQGQQIDRVPLTFALFEHSSSRLGDPQLHVHAVCPNLTLRVNERGNERVTAINSTEFYHHMMTAGALFRASLAQGMRELGFQVEKDGFAFRLKGISEELCERFSQRRAEIVEAILKAAKLTKHLSELDAREVLKAASGRMAELVNLSTRKGKPEYTREELFPIWQNIARWLGISENYVQELIGKPHQLTPDQKFQTKEELFRETLGKLTEEYSHFGAKDLTRKLAEEAQGRGLTGPDIRELVSNKISTQEVLKLGEVVTEKPGQNKHTYRQRVEERFTTEETLLREDRMIAAVERMAKRENAISPKVAEQAIERTAAQLKAKGHKFTAEQADAVRYLTAGPGLIACMTGKAGTGKSTTLETCRFAWELSGRKVIGCAIQGETAFDLQRTTGIQSMTLASLLLRLQHGRITLTKDHVVVLEESGMVPTKALDALIKFTEQPGAGAKIVLAGDAAQLQAIGAGGPFRSISERLKNLLGIECVLTKIIRQKHEWHRDAVVKLSQGEAREALIAFAANNQLHVTKGRDDAISGLVARWKADNGIENSHGVLLLASLNVEVRTINRLCQGERLKAGKLGEEKLYVNGDNIHEKDRVLLTNRSTKFGVENGWKGEVIKVDEGRQSLTIRLDVDGRTVTLPIKDYGAKHIKLGYASTTHKAQGKTVEHCHVLLGGHMQDLHMGYVQTSRAKESTHLFIDQAHAGPELRDAVRTLSRSRMKDLARDITDRTYEAPRETVKLAQKVSVTPDVQVAQEQERQRTEQRQRGIGLRH